MNNYYRVVLGKNGKYAEQCYKGQYIGLYSKVDQDLIHESIIDLKKFREKYIDIIRKNDPRRTKIGASNGCGYLFALSKGMKVGDVVLCPDKEGFYMIGEISGDYYYDPEDTINHRRIVKWYNQKLDRANMSDPLRKLVGTPHTILNLNKHEQELNSLILQQPNIQITTNDEDIEDVSVFALEKHLEDFLIKNWNHTELGKNYDIYEEDGELVGQQFQSDTGPIDILAISKDKKELLVIELKKGRASDRVVGQIQRYMAFVKDELTENDQTVKGVIIAQEDSLQLRRSLEVANNIDLYLYQVSFRLKKK